MDEQVLEVNRIGGRDLALESSALYEPLRRLSLVGFQGTTAELLNRLNAIASEGTRHSMRWPKAPNALSSSLRRLASNLRSTGIDLQFSRADGQGRRMISLHTTAGSPKRSSVIVSDNQ